MAMRFMNGLSLLIDSLSDPEGLKAVVERLGLQHMDFEVTVQRVIMLRTAILLLLQAEMGERLSLKAKVGFATMLNYVGGSFIYIYRREFYLRLEITRMAWRNRIRNMSMMVDMPLAVDEEGHESAGEQ